MLSLRAHVFRVAADGPDDISGVEALFKNGLNPRDVVAILGKTEGNGCVNDFTRGYATRSFETLFAKHGVEGVSIVMSGGTEGALSPHWTVFARESVQAPGERSLAIGVARTPALASGHLGRREQVLMVADAVKSAMTDAGIEDVADVHFVQIKCPLLTTQRIAQAEASGKTPATRDTLKSMGLSRGASALGVAVALGEINAEEIDRRCRHRHALRSLFSRCASASAGVELLDHEIVVLGMSSKWSGPLSIDHAVMRRRDRHAIGEEARDRLPPMAVLRRCWPRRSRALLARVAATGTQC
jgi:cyanuric acid amidohydrolase